MDESSTYVPVQSPLPVDRYFGRKRKGPIALGEFFSGKEGIEVLEATIRHASVSVEFACLANRQK